MVTLILSGIVVICVFLKIKYDLVKIFTSSKIYNFIRTQNDYITLYSYTYNIYNIYLKILHDFLFASLSTKLSGNQTLTCKP